MRFDFFGMTNKRNTVAPNTARPALCLLAWAAVRIRLAALLVLLSLVALNCIAPSRAMAADSAIPPDLQALFVEAEGEFPVRTLADMPRPSPANFYWVDNHRVIYTIRKFNGWEARTDERSKIIIYDVDTGKVEETHYRGNLRCFGTGGQILVQDYALPFVDHIQPGDTRDDTQYFLIGKLGEPLTRYKRLKEHWILDRFSCQFYSNSDQSFGSNHVIQRLLPSDGVLDIANYIAADSMVRLLSPDLQVRWTIDTDKRCNGFGIPVYLAWSQQYFVASAFGNIVPGCPNPNKESWLFSKDSIDAKPLPKLVQEARKYSNGLAQAGTTFWARPGMFVLIQLSAGILDGLYWIDEKSSVPKRVLKKQWGLNHLSPDGCRNVVLADPPVIIELCNGEKS